MVGRGERATGTPNTIYDLSSVLFHALQAGVSYDRYIRDAEEADDRELAEFFRVLRDQDDKRADYAQELLAERTPAATGGREEEAARPDSPPRTEPSGAFPATEPTTGGESPPEAEPSPAPAGTESLGASSRKEEEPPSSTTVVPPPVAPPVPPSGTAGASPGTEDAAPRPEGDAPEVAPEAAPEAGRGEAGQQRLQRVPQRPAEEDRGHSSQDKGLIDKVREKLLGSADEEAGRSPGPAPLGGGDQTPTEAAGSKVGDVGDESDPGLGRDQVRRQSTREPRS